MMSAFKLVQRDAEGKHSPFWELQGSDEMRQQDKCHSMQDSIQIIGQALLCQEVTAIPYQAAGLWTLTLWSFNGFPGEHLLG